MEDDVGLSWPALEAWAYDESLLAPMGLHRGFVRVQPAQWDGSLIANDQVYTTSLGSGHAAISVPHTSEHPNGKVRVLHTWHQICAMHSHRGITLAKAALLAPPVLSLLSH